MSGRVNPTPSQRKRILEKNANVCCVCKVRGMGLELHHIDGDNSNTVDGNLAVLCAKDHDYHHRPNAYNMLNCRELSATEIKEYKDSWESFVNEAKQNNPRIVAVLNVYGNEHHIHSMRLILQWENGKVEFERIFHLLDGSYETWIDNMLEEVDWLGKGIKIVLIDEPLEIEYCPTCQKAYSNILDERITKKINSENWSKESIASIYVNPSFPSLAITISYNHEEVYSGHLHKCGDYLHYVSDNFEERVKVPKRSVRTEVTRLVSKVLANWQPAHKFFGTGDPESPKLIKKLILPSVWENRRSGTK